LDIYIKTGSNEGTAKREESCWSTRKLSDVKVVIEKEDSERGIYGKFLSYILTEVKVFDGQYIASHAFKIFKERSASFFKQTLDCPLTVHCRLVGNNAWLDTGSPILTASKGFVPLNKKV